MKHLHFYVFCFAAFFFSFSVIAQNKKIVGKIITFNNYPIQKAEVSVKSTKEKVYSDTLGIFVVNCNDKDKIIIKAKGFFEQSFHTQDNSDTIKVNLVFKGGDKNKQMATGYGHIDEHKLTYAIDHLSNENIPYEFYANIFDMLKSKVPGVQVNGTSINIRGKNTMSSTETPLLVVDGFTVGLNTFKNIDPQNVKSIDVLKDAAASARYGSRGMHGVIVVTTKKNNS